LTGSVFATFSGSAVYPFGDLAPVYDGGDSTFKPLVNLLSLHS